MTIQLKSADEVSFWITESGYLCFKCLNQGTGEFDTICLTPEQFFCVSSYVNDRKEEIVQCWNNGYSFVASEDNEVCI